MRANEYRKREGKKKQQRPLRKNVTAEQMLHEDLLPQIDKEGKTEHKRHEHNEENKRRKRRKESSTGSEG